MIISQTETDRANNAIASTESRLLAFDFLYLHLKLVHSKGQDQEHAYFDSEYLADGERQDKHGYCQYVQSRLLACDLILTHCKGQGQGHAYFDCEYLADGEV